MWRLARSFPQRGVSVNFFCVRWKGSWRFPLEIPRPCLAMPFRRDRSVTVLHLSCPPRPGFLLLMDLRFRCHMGMQYHVDLPMLWHKGSPMQSRRAKSLLLASRSLLAKEF